MKVFKARTKKIVVIKGETEAEKSFLCCYPKNIGLRDTSDPLTFHASLSQIPESDFENFKAEVLK